MKLRDQSVSAQSGKKSALDKDSAKHRSGGVGSEMCSALDVEEVDIRSKKGSSLADDAHRPKKKGVKKGKMGGVGPQGKLLRKKTRGRVKIKMEFIKNKARRYTTFSKRKIGIMKKAYELAMLTGTQILVVVVSETGHVYTNGTHKLQPLITSEEGKALIQTCFNSPDPPSHYDPSTDVRITTKGFEEADLNFQVSEPESLEHTEDAGLQGTTDSDQSTTVPTASSTNLQMSSTMSLSYPNYLSTYGSYTEQMPSGYTIMPAGTPYPPGTPTISLSQLQQHSLATQQQLGQAFTSPVSHGHMMYNNPHTVLYSSTHTGLYSTTHTGQYVYSQGPSAIQMSYAQTQ